jgi:hypothetical protein
MNLKNLEEIANKSLVELLQPGAPVYENSYYYDTDLHKYISNKNFELNDDEWKVILKYFPDYIFFANLSHELQDYALSFIEGKENSKNFVMPGYSRYNVKECLENVNNPSEKIINYYLSEYLRILPKNFKKNLTLKHFEKAFKELCIKEVLD